MPEEATSTLDTEEVTFSEILTLFFFFFFQCFAGRLA